MNESWIPKGFHTITPNIIVNDAESAISFLKRAFGAIERYRLTASNGKVAHCELAWAIPWSTLASPWRAFPRTRW